MTIIADTFEPPHLKTLLIRSRIQVELMSLKVGDYVIGTLYGIERKTHSDFLASFYNQRLFDQLRSMMQYFFPILVIEGRHGSLETKSGFFDFKMIEVKLTALQIGFPRLTIRASPNVKGTAAIIAWIHQKLERDAQRIDKERLPQKLPSTLTDKQLHAVMLTALKGVGEIAAIALIKKFKGLYPLMFADVKDIATTPVGKRTIGMKKAQYIKEKLRLE